MLSLFLHELESIKEHIMISVKGKYENGRIELSLPPKIQSSTNVIVTFWKRMEML